MSTKNFLLDCKILLKPVWHDDLPEVSVKLNQRNYFSGKLAEVTEISIKENLPEGKHFLSVDFLNKNNADTIPGTDLDKAVVIESIEFNKIHSPRFVWNGIYKPIYPDEWADQNAQNGITLPGEIQFCNYLGWNGTWRLDFTAPIFTWIHQIENHGWLYE